MSLFFFFLHTFHLFSSWICDDGFDYSSNGEIVIIPRKPLVENTFLQPINCLYYPLIFHVSFSFIVFRVRAARTALMTHRMRTTVTRTTDPALPVRDVAILELAPFYFGAIFWIWHHFGFGVILDLAPFGNWRHFEIGSILDLAPFWNFIVDQFELKLFFIKTFNLK